MPASLHRMLHNLPTYFVTYRLDHKEAALHFPSPLILGNTALMLDKTPIKPWQVISVHILLCTDHSELLKRLSLFFSCESGWREPCLPSTKAQSSELCSTVPVGITPEPFTKCRAVNSPLLPPFTLTSFICLRGSAGQLPGCACLPPFYSKSEVAVLSKLQICVLISSNCLALCSSKLVSVVFSCLFKIIFWLGRTVLLHILW